MCFAPGNHVVCPYFCPNPECKQPANKAVTTAIYSARRFKLLAPSAGTLMTVYGHKVLWVAHLREAANK